MIFITRRATFSAAHRLARKDWSEEKNLEVFGKCANPNWHGHNYILWVTVKGEVNPETGFVANLTDISQIVTQYVLDKIDHRNLDQDVDFMSGKLSSTETLAIAIWEQIEAPVNNLGCTLHSVRLQETEKNFVEYFGK
jgi:6-pyruvoyltetrahydropterin/6-carboxytetrahydropterin synthase